jgi:uncharacterized membrane protein
MNNNILFWLGFSEWFSLFIFMAISFGYIRDKISTLEVKLIPIDVRTEMMFKHMISETFALRNEVEYIKTMLQLQQIRERQQSKPQEQSDEIRAEI